MFGGLILHRIVVWNSDKANVLHEMTLAFENNLITEAKTLDDALPWLKGAIKALRVSRSKLHRKLALSKEVS